MKSERPKCSILIDNGNREVLMQLRDDNPDIIFPNCLTTFGGAIEENETPREAMMREMLEETGYKLKKFQYWKTITYNGYDIHVFYTIDKDLKLEDLTIMEGQKGVWVSKDNIDTLPYKFGFNFKKLVLEYFALKQVLT